MYRIIVPKHTTRSKLWEEKLDDIFEGTRFDGVRLSLVSKVNKVFLPRAYDVEAVYIRFFDPSFKFVRHFGRCTNNRRSKPPDRDVLGHGELGPFGDAWR